MKTKLENHIQFTNRKHTKMPSFLLLSLSVLNAVLWLKNCNRIHMHTTTHIHIYIHILILNMES